MKNIISSAIIFLSGFLVLSIQLILGKSILPFFGGSPNTWISSLAFFQCFLSVGYLYSYLNQKYLNFNNQIKTHLLLSICALISLYFADFDYRATSVFLTLTFIIGVPYLVLTTFSPIIQSWYASYFKENPYYLYIFSNLGTFSSLMAYPLLIEPNIDTNVQVEIFKILFSFLFITYILVSTLLIFKTKNIDYGKKVIKDSLIKNKDKLKIILFAFVPSAFLGVVTTKITTDISPMPLLWVIPLGLYFISFSIAFYDKFKLNDKFICITFASFLFLIVNIYNNNPALHIFINLYLSFFLVSIYCHKKIYNLKPHSDDLPLFYFIMSIGGFLGGLFTGIIAPVIFNDYYEVFITVLIFIFMLKFDNNNKFNKYALSSFLLLAFICVSGSNYIKVYKDSEIIFKDRTFFGVYKVKKSDNVNSLIHGTTIHGSQINNSNEPLSYYSLENTISLAINSYPDYKDVAVVGLGSGALSCSTSNDINLDYFEIDQIIIDIANNDDYFNYISLCPKLKKNFFLGDARIELKKIEKNKYDIIIIDAFSSDSIPTHLLTKEAFELYIEKIKYDGLIVFHISNRHINLEIPISNIAKALNKESKVCLKNSSELENETSHASKTITIGKNLNYMDSCYKKSLNNDDKIWTDSFNSILKYIK